MTKVLVVDDSALTRKHLQEVLSDEGFVVATASNGQECLERIPQYQPDVITLDINMPVMDGLTCLRSIMNSNPTPVVMISSLTEKGARASFEALELGAVDYIPKPGSKTTTHSLMQPYVGESANTLFAKLRSAARVNVLQANNAKATSPEARKQPELRFERHNTVAICKRPSAEIELVLVGVSTGGPGTLKEIITRLPSEFPVPIVIAQHMPSRFTSVFAERLNGISRVAVSEVSHISELKPGNVYIAKGDADITIVRRGNRLYADSIPADENILWHPSVDALVSSATNVIPPSKVLCVQLTGMGDDGAASMTLAHEKGATTIAESEDTAVVFGMPRELISRGAADKILPNYDIAQAIIESIY
ncbi:MAG: chemotaxis-specific protein-glutamate methyltransferase CheB [Pseudomonadota bacterium]